MSGSRSQPVTVLLVSLASVFVIAWGVKSSAAVINPILLATVITIIVLPMPQYFMKRGLPSWLSFALTLLLVVGGLAVTALLVVFSLGNMSVNVSSQISSSVEALSLPDWINTNFGTSLISSLASGAAQMFMVMLIFIFMLSGALVKPNLSMGTELSAVMSQITRLTQDVRRYMSIMTVINFWVAVGNVILLWILGIESALVWGLLSWVMGYIPNIGFWIALIPPTLIAYATQGLETAVIVVIGYTLINGSVQNFIQPRMMGQGLGISTVVVFISLFVWGWLLGGIGAILSVPLTMIIMAVLNEFESTRWIAVLMSAPRNEQAAEHTNAQERLRGIWQRAKHTIQGTAGESDDPE